MTTLAARRLDDFDRRMAGHLADLARNMWAMGHLCNEVAREEVYREGGYATVFDWAQDRHRSSRRTIEKAMAIATHFNSDMAERHGSEKLSATVDYLKTTARIEKAGEANALQFRIPGKSGRFETVPFERATAADIERARELVRQSKRGQAAPPAPPPADDLAKRRADRLAAALAPVPRSTVRGARVEVVRDSAGQQRYTFRGVAEHELEAFARAVLASL
jgi:hypothetical protein